MRTSTSIRPSEIALLTESRGLVSSFRGIIIDSCAQCGADMRNESTPQSASETSTYSYRQYLVKLLLFDHDSSAYCNVKVAAIIPPSMAAVTERETYGAGARESIRPFKRGSLVSQ